MGEPVLGWVAPTDISAEDVLWLQKADKAGGPFHALPLERLLADLHAGRMHLFRFKPGPGVLLLSSYEAASGMKCLQLVRVAGRGVVFTSDRLVELLQHTAREWGCQRIETMVYSKRLAEAMRRRGAKAEAINMVMEVPNG